MKFSRMQDIGGCRAVVPDMNDVHALKNHFVRNSKKRNGRADRVRDYTVEPQESGYRALHIYTQYQGYRIEVQLRTPLQQNWAVSVERWGAFIDEDLKSGKGPQLWLDYFRMAAEGIQLQEAGIDADRQFMTRFGNVRGEVQADIDRRGART